MISGPITTRSFAIIWNLSLKLSSENFFIDIFFYTNLFFRIYIFQDSMHEVYALKAKK